MPLACCTLASSCYSPRYVYSPAAVNVPLITKKGDSKLAGYYSINPGEAKKQTTAGELNSGYGLDIQAAYAITNHFAIQGSYTKRWEKNYADFNLNSNDSSMINYSRSSTEFADTETLVRVHEPLSVIDLLDMHDDTHSWSVNDALHAIADAGCGVVVLLHRKESAAELMERVASTKSEAPAVRARTDLRDYGIGAQILRDLNVGKMRLLATPRKMPSMTGFDLEVTGYVEAGNS